METKKCGRCKIERPLTDFWKNKIKADGYNYVCRVCYRDTDRKRYYQDVKHSRRRKLKTANGMQAKYPEKWQARSLLRYAVKIGQIKKQPCEVCGEKKVEAHHEDYTKPLDVHWVCIIHHREKFHRKYAE